jgi:hypothetical protein
MIIKAKSRGLSYWSGKKTCTSPDPASPLFYARVLTVLVYVEESARSSMASLEQTRDGTGLPIAAYGTSLSHAAILAELQPGERLACWAK